jgi:hypothetical protein
LADPWHKALKTTRSGDGIDMALPSTALNPVPSVLVLTAKG